MTRARRLRALLVLVAAITAVLAVAAGPASAHAELVSSTPANGSVLTVAPASVDLTFSEQIDLSLATFVLRTTGNRRIEPAGVGFAGRDNRAVSVRLPHVPDGAYALTWQATTSDGHTAAGDVQFVVGRGTTASGGSGVPLGGIAVGGRGGATLSAAAALGRFCWYLAVCLVAGALVWGRLVQTGSLQSDEADAVDDPGRAVVGATATGALRVGWRAMAVVALARVTVLLLTLQHAAPSLATLEVLRHLLRATQGRAWLALVYATALLWIPVRRLLARGVLRSADSERARAAVLAMLAVTCAAEALTGHAASSPSPAIATVSVAVHVLAFATWLGALGLLVVLLWRRAWRALPPDARGPVLTGFLHGFGRVGIGAVTALVVTGVVNSWQLLGRIGALTGSHYGRVLTVKLVVVALALPFGLWHWRSAPSRARDEAVGRMRAAAARLLPRTAAAEAALVVAVVVLAAVLTGQAPGRTPVAAAGTLAAAAAPKSAADCARAPIETTTCYEQYLSTVVDHRGPAAALAELHVLAAKSQLVVGDCHQLTHSIGRESFRVLKSPVKALVYSSSLCNSGYQHGVIEAAIAGMDAAALRVEIPKLCDPATAHYRPYSFDHYNCLHGIGHGITTQLRDDVFASLPYCDALSGNWEQQSCFSGVFMQKVIGDFNGVSSDAHGKDPVWPCDVVQERMKRSCYLIATGRVLRVLNYDYGGAFHVCDGIEAAWVDTCYQSMGRDISGAAHLDATKTLQLCDQAGRLGPDSCLDGAVRNAVDEEHGPSHATALCDASPAVYRDRCRRVRDQAVSLL